MYNVTKVIHSKFRQITKTIKKQTAKKAGQLTVRYLIRKEKHMGKKQLKKALIKLLKRTIKFLYKSFVEKKKKHPRPEGEEVHES